MSKSYILLVEDNDDDVALTQRAFRKSNIANEVVVVRNGVEALDFLFGCGDYAERDTRHLPEMILLDIQLPMLNGLEVLQKIRADELTRYVPVIVLTSSDEERDLFDSYNFGANSYIRKPVDFNRFIEAVQQLGMYWLVLNQLPPRSN